MKTTIIYWSGTGNTEKMAELIAQGAKEAGAEVSIKNVANSSISDADDCNILLLGCPSMGDEVLEESEFEPFISSIEGKLKGKKVKLFGSYDWGDGRWMREWDERMQAAGADIIGECLIVNNYPEGEDAAACIDFGKTI